MLHETLLLLWHNPTNSDEASKLFELQEFLHPGEKELLRRILDISSDYHWIVAFCNRILDIKPCGDSLNRNNTPVSAGEGSKVETPPPGLYIKAFANGVMNVLEDYQNQITVLERTFLDNPQLNLTFVLGSLEKYRELFVALKAIIQVLQKDNLHGCLLMGRLHKYIYSGVDCIENAAKIITKSFNIIFYRHLCSWIIYGELVDEYNEFFIRDEKCPDENFLYPEQLEETPSTNSSGLVVDMIRNNRMRRPPPVRKFSINWDLVPMFINEDTAESILFMGRIVWIVQNDPKKVTSRCQMKNPRDIWEGREIEYYKKVQALANQIFDEVEFKHAIEECRIKLTKYLWSVMLDEGNLKEHLQLIRDYYALGRGELFNQFITVAEDHVKASASLENSVHNLNFIFSETARKIYGENDKTYMRFELATSKSENSNANPWSKLQLNFEIKWPLHIVFHPKSMELYNQLFTYLLRLKKTQIHLHKLWHLHMSTKQKIDIRVWTLRQHLIFLVNNLQYYLQVDVIEAQFSLLLKAVESANEFEDIIKVHHEFISNLLAKTFVLTPDEGHIYQNKHRLHQMPAVKFDVPNKVYNVITRLLELCDEFCVVASTWDETLTKPEILELGEFQRRTEAVVDSLLFILYSLHEKAKGQHLLQLLCQLDFNRYFSRYKPDFNLTVAT